MEFKPLYETELGKMYCENSLEIMKAMEGGSIDLVFTSPPYALHFKKEYGNAEQKEYIDWFIPFAQEIKRVLKPTGSFVLNIGGTWTPGAPVRSLYHFKLLIELCEKLEFRLAQEFFWYNPAKMPAPAEWVNVRRIRVKDSVEYIYWLSKNDFPKADNRNILQAYSKDMERLIKRGVKKTRRPSGHNITTKFNIDQGGSIPGNLIESGNNESNSGYIKLSKKLGKKIHPARFPAALPELFIKFLTERNDVVLDPFAGSNTTGAVAESLERKWISAEINKEYAQDSEIRFTENLDIDEEKNKGGQLELFPIAAAQ